MTLCILNDFRRQKTYFEKNSTLYAILEKIASENLTEDQKKILKELHDQFKSIGEY